MVGNYYQPERPGTTNLAPNMAFISGRNKTKTTLVKLLSTIGFQAAGNTNNFTVNSGRYELATSTDLKKASNMPRMPRKRRDSDAREVYKDRGATMPGLNRQADAFGDNQF